MHLANTVLYKYLMEETKKRLIHMEINHRIAIKLAEEVSPDDVELAPIMIDSFLESPAKRRELLSRDKRNVLGSIGAPSSPSELSLIFLAISTFADVISTLFSPELYNLIKKYLFSPKSESPINKSNDFKKLLDSFSNELSTMGISKDKSEQIAFKVIKVLMEEPEGKRFVKNLGAIINE
jgi:hypothetical protein